MLKYINTATTTDIVNLMYDVVPSMVGLKDIQIVKTRNWIGVRLIFIDGSICRYMLKDFHIISHQNPRLNIGYEYRRWLNNKFGAEYLLDYVLSKDNKYDINDLLK